MVEIFLQTVDIHSIKEISSNILSEKIYTHGIEDNHGLFYYKQDTNITTQRILWKLKYINQKHTLQSKNMNHVVASSTDDIKPSK